MTTDNNNKNNSIFINYKNSEIMIETRRNGMSTNFNGILYKWTNYIYGWQKRFVVLSNGNLLYSSSYKASDASFNCTIHLSNATIQVNSKDELRFDLTTPETSYYFRAPTTEDRMVWVSHILRQREAINGSSRRTPSMSSVSSISSAFGSTATTDNNSQLMDMINELNTLKDSLIHQIGNLQHYYDIISSFVDSHNDSDLHDSDTDQDRAASTQVAKIQLPGYVVARQAGHRFTKSLSFSPTEPSFGMEADFLSKIQKYLADRKINLTNEVINFRSSTSGIMSTLSCCIELLENYDKKSQNELLKQKEINRDLNQQIKLLTNDKSNRQLIGCPDSVEGPNMLLPQDEFFDALQSVYYKEEELQLLEKPFDVSSVDENPYAKKLNQFVAETIEYLIATTLNDEAWILCTNDYPTKIYKKDVVIDDIVVDPYRVIHLYQGITAKEVCSYFWDVDHRLNTDSTVDNVFVKAKYGENVVVVHQLHKHIWPATRRDSCFVSELRKLDDSKVIDRLLTVLCDEYDEFLDCEPIDQPYLVANLSVDHPEVQSNDCIRVDARVVLLAQSFVRKSSEKTRPNIVTLINYSAQINPGGWLPHAAVRALAKREYSKFVRKLGEYVTKNTELFPASF